MFYATAIPALILLGKKVFGLCNTPLYDFPIAYAEDDNSASDSPKRRLVFYYKQPKVQRLLGQRVLYIEPCTLRVRLGFLVETNSRTYYIPQEKKLVPTFSSHSLVCDSLDVNESKPAIVPFSLTSAHS